MALSGGRALGGAASSRRRRLQCLHSIVRTSWDSLRAHFADDGPGTSSAAALAAPRSGKGRAEGRTKVAAAAPVGNVEKTKASDPEKKMKPGTVIGTTKVGEKNVASGRDAKAGEKGRVSCEEKKRDGSKPRFDEKRKIDSNRRSGSKPVLEQKKKAPSESKAEKSDPDTKNRSKLVRDEKKSSRPVSDEKKRSDAMKKDSGKSDPAKNSVRERKTTTRQDSQPKKAVDAKTESSIEKKTKPTSRDTTKEEKTNATSSKIVEEREKSPSTEEAATKKTSSSETDVQKLQKEEASAQDRAARQKLRELSAANKSFKAELATERRLRKWEGGKQEFNLEEADRTPWGRDRHRRDLHPRQDYSAAPRIEASKEKLDEIRAVESLKYRRELFYSQPACIDTVELGNALRECARTKNLPEGRKIHARLAEGFYDRYTYLGNLLIQMYGNCGRIEDARSVFNMLDEKNVFSWNIMQAAFIQNGFLQGAREIFDANPDKSVVSWNSMMAAYAQRGMLDEAKSIFESMPTKNIVSWTGMLQAFSRSGNIDEAKQLFDRMEDRDPVTWNTMLSAFAAKGYLQETKNLFDQIPVKDRVTWTAMITAHAQSGQGKEAIRYYYLMALEGLHPNKVTCLTVLHACAELKNPKVARALHRLFVENGLEVDVTIGTALVDMYAKCGDLFEAQTIFDRMPDRDVVTWTAMTTALASAGKFDDAKGLFAAMPTKNVVSHNTMLSALINSGKLAEARAMFDRMSEKNWHSWNSMILGYAKAGLGRDSLAMFARMDLEGFYADRSAYASALTACASIPAPVQGRILHQELIDTGGLEDDAVLTTALVDMYASSGGLAMAEGLFREMVFKDGVAWTAMVAGYVRNDLDDEAVALFREMLVEGLSPEAVTFLHLFSACSHLGLVEECRWYFVSMIEDYKLVPELDHYLCLIDLLGRAGQLDRAEELIETMPFQPVAGAWRTLLSACKMHNDKARAERVAGKNSELEPKSGSPYLMLSNLNAEAGNARVEQDQDQDRAPQREKVAENYDRMEKRSWQDQTQQDREQAKPKVEQRQRGRDQEQQRRGNADLERSLDELSSRMEEHTSSRPEERNRQAATGKRGSSGEWPEMEFQTDDRNGYAEDPYSERREMLGLQRSNDGYSRSRENWGNHQQRPQGEFYHGSGQRSEFAGVDGHSGDYRKGMERKQAVDEQDIWREEESFQYDYDRDAGRGRGRNACDDGDDKEFYKLRQQAVTSKSGSDYYSLVEQGNYASSNARKDTEFFYDKKQDGAPRPAASSFQGQEFYEPEYGYKW